MHVSELWIYPIKSCRGVCVDALDLGDRGPRGDRRWMLVDENGNLTQRGRAIIAHTPAGRFGEPAELVGTAIWLCSPAASFVNGAVIPVDGGFGAFSGV